MKRIAVLLVTALTACSPAAVDMMPQVKTVNVVADAALTEAFTKIATDFTAAHGIVPVFTYGAGSALEKQLTTPPMADVFASASHGEMKLVSKVFARNRIVIATAPGNPKDIRGLANFAEQSNPRATFAMCVEEAPCGEAAKDVLAGGGFQDGILPAPAARGQDVKETLAKLTAGEVDAAFVYASDVKANPKAQAPEVFVAEPKLIDFPVAVVSGNPQALKFYEYLFSVPAQQVLTDAGFSLP
jgi:molybdate transport system substrate-binding protein